MSVFKIADVAFELESKNKEVIRFLAPYSYDGDYEVKIEITHVDIEYEKNFSCNENSFVLEATAVLRKFCDVLLYRFEGMFLHAATVIYRGEAYAFSAPSGTGKTTHILKWKKLFGEKVSILNGDKLFLRCIDNDIVAYGNPWQGKENLGENLNCPLKGIFVIKRDETNFVRQLSEIEALKSLVDSTLFPKDKEGRNKQLDFLDKLISNVNVFELHCNLEDEAVYTAISAIEGDI
jgi:hypothetical protein